MAVFEYAALDASGRQRKGIVEGDSSRHARQLLRDQGLAPLTVESAKENNGRSISLDFIKEKVGPPDLSLFPRDRGAFRRARMANHKQQTTPLVSALEGGFR